MPLGRAVREVLRMVLVDAVEALVQQLMKHGGFKPLILVIERCGSHGRQPRCMVKHVV